MTEPKKPQDHQPKAAPVEDEHPAGWELMKPFDQIPVWEQAEVLDLARPFFSLNQDNDGNVDIDDLDFKAVGALAHKLMDYAVDRDAYQAFVSGPGALGRSMQLAVAYAFQLGE